MAVAQLVSIAFIMGLVGSLHCVGMCGPIALTLPIHSKSTSNRLIASLIYNSGRIFTYSWLGLLLGLTGSFLVTPSIQSILSIVFGGGILVYLFLPTSVKRNWFNGSSSNHFFIHLRNGLTKLLHNPNPSSLFAIGILNGLLPCGMIYMALASSILTGGAIKGSLFMAAFGAGTLPATISVVYFGTYFSQHFRIQLRKAVPVFLFGMACLLVLRGLNLGIPYISPALPNASTGAEVVCHQ